MHPVTLPIEHTDGLRMDPQEARALGSLLADDYRNADPFPHIVLDNALPEPLIRDIYAHFPKDRLAKDVVFDIGYGGHHKRQVMPEHCDAFARQFFHFMNSQPMLQFLEGLTGIDALLPDPYFTGGGFHETARGGKLGVHADFRIHDQLNVQRRINLLIYLNETWDDAWRGQLELWDRSMSECRVRVSPLWNRCVVFSTDADSWHGHPDELLTPDHVKRRSLALYYYTASKNVYNEVPNLSTMYQARPTDSAATRKEAREFKNEQYLRDWMPPVLLRGLYKARRGVAKMARGLRRA
ncbi:MAG: 2OG-Fe(II) oxygenase [Aquincola sp.]|nr:2OG-Fe(II) oxygenase [Aquincola sp.]